MTTRNQSRLALRSAAKHDLALFSTLVAALLLSGCEARPNATGTASVQAAAAQADSGKAASAETTLQPVILNADEYKQQIIDIDRLSFEDKPMAKDRSALLATRLEQLADRIKPASDSRFIAIEVTELQQLASMARDLPTAGPRTAFCNQWMRIRNNLFDDRSWFARSAADLDPAQAEIASTTPAATETAPTKTAEPIRLSVDSVLPFRNLPTPEPATHPPVPHKLQGRWRVVGLYANGQPRSDPELSNATFTFDDDQLFVEGLTRSRYTFVRVKDEQGSALRLTSHPSNNGPSENGWMIYEFGETGLKLGFYDGLGYRPPDFSPPPGTSDPLLMVVVLQSTP